MSISPETITRDQEPTTPLLLEMQPHKEYTFSPHYHTGIKAVNETLQVSQEAVAKITAGRQDFVINRVSVAGNSEGYAVTMPSADPEGRAQLVAYVTPGQKLIIGRSEQPSLKEHNYLSRKHFAVRVDIDGMVALEDVGAANGTELAQVSADDPVFQGLDWVASSKELKDVMSQRVGVPEHAGNIGAVARRAILDLSDQVDANRNTKILSDYDIQKAVEAAISQSEYNAQIAETFAQVLPTNGIEINGRTYAIGEIFQAHHRKMLVMFAENADGQYKPRLFYKSKSDGGWRSCPGIYGNGTFSKGEDYDNGGYVWATKPAEDIIRAIEELEAQTVIKEQPKLSAEVDEMFAIKRLIQSGIYGFEAESRSTFIPGTDRQHMFLYESLEPGVGFAKGISKSLARYRLENLVLPEGFTPDFDTIVRKYTFEHTLLGPSTVTVHSASVEGRDIEWHVASAQDGTVWIDKILYSPVDINSYGTYSEFIKGGALATKPLEYEAQTKTMEGGKDFTYTSGSSAYVSMRPTIDRMPWAKAYRTAQNIN